MTVFTCLLICYNPRDDLGEELVKTGVMTEEDIESLRSLKLSGKQLSMKSKNGRPTIVMDEKNGGRPTFVFSDDDDQAEQGSKKKTQSDNGNRSLSFRGRRSIRISPTPSDSEDHEP